MTLTNRGFRDSEPAENIGRQNVVGMSKFTGSSVQQSFASPLCFGQDGIGAKYDQSHVTYNNRNVHKQDLIRDEDSAEETTVRVDAQRDMEAAHALVEMANGDSFLHKCGVNCYGKNHGMNEVQGNPILMAKLDEGGVSYDTDTQAAVTSAKEHSEEFQQSAVEGQTKDTVELLLLLLLRKKRKRKVGSDLSSAQSTYMNYKVGEEYTLCENRGFFVHDASSERLRMKQEQNIEASASDGQSRLGMQFLGNDFIFKRQKRKARMKYVGGPDKGAQLPSKFQNLIIEPTTCVRNVDKLLKMGNGTSFLAGRTCNLPFSETGSMVDPMLGKKQQFTLITPTLHTSASFSIIHLLSAVRTAMVTHAGGGLMCDKCNKGGTDSRKTKSRNLPSLTLQEIVQRVSSNPGDPRILQTQEPLQDLVRGALKMFSSKIAPLGAKGWMVLAIYEKSSKHWSWIGPLSTFETSKHDHEEDISPAAWGLPNRMLVKMVDSFAKWLKSTQMTLQQLGSLPAPPVALMQPSPDVKERFKYLRAQKSLATISLSTEEVRTYFRREEILRYFVPERAFSYTAVDGRKSTVAPMRRCSGKPSTKARDHFMLKPDRPPYVTILCLVRDAAARLPGSIGTRADVCTLIRDSQFIMENVSDIQLHQVVSGALDRLHYELDPCVQFEKDRQLWVYLHGERDEEDFEFDGTYSTKNWKRQQRNVMETSVQENSNPLQGEIACCSVELKCDLSFA